MLVSGLLTLSSLASAQALQGAANAAGNVRAPVLPPPPPPPAATANIAAQGAAAANVRAPVLPPPAVNAAANVAAQGAAAAAGAVRTPVTPSVNPNASGAAQSHVAAGASSAGTPNINAQTQVSAQGQAAGAAFANTTASQATVTVDVADNVNAIRAAAFAQRERVNADVQARLDASAAQVANLQARAETAGEKSRAALAKALVEVRQREADLRASLRDSARATKESAWGEIQSALARNYGAYAQAVIQAEAAVKGDAATEPKS